MTPQQKIFSVIVSVAVFLFIIELVRRRNLKEEYSWLWIFTGFIMIIFTVWYDLLVFVTHMIGAIAPTTTLFIFSILFLLALNIHFSTVISKLTNQVKNLSQEIALLNAGRDGDKK
ncbi:MAG TPA: DUF2304 domain-containing protein [bacterium]